MLFIGISAAKAIKKWLSGKYGLRIQMIKCREIVFVTGNKWPTLQVKQSLID